MPIVLGIGLVLLATTVPVFRPYDGSPHSLVGWLAYAWDQSADTRHGAIVPFIAAWLVWRKRGDLAALPRQGTWLGVAVATVGAVLFWLGWKGDIHYVNYLAYLVIVAGLVLAHFGARWFYELAFAWSFLVFAMPMPFLDEILGFRLRLFMAGASTAILNLLGIEAVRRGTAIYSAMDPSVGLPEGRVFSLDVADPCSGLNSLFALIMLTALYAHLTQHRLWKQWFLFMCALPLAVLGNMFRVTSIAIVAAGIDQQFASGPYHTIAGYLVFVVAIGSMLLVGKLLDTDWRAKIRRIGRPIDPARHRPSDAY
ncbi:MAG: exosortase/archaeosortase family protein [Verrucomicrobiae bacterium]|nr:exosortase/archaeosortase family protein [Verrucomicrobiae bacterium]